MQRLLWPGECLVWFGLRMIVGSSAMIAIRLLRTAPLCGNRPNAWLSRKLRAAAMIPDLPNPEMPTRVWHAHEPPLAAEMP